MNKRIVIAAIGAAQPWQIGFQTTASPLFERIVDLHNDILCVLVGIVCGVFFACAHICLGYSLPSKKALEHISHQRDLLLAFRARKYTRRKVRGIAIQIMKRMVKLHSRHYRSYSRKLAFKIQPLLRIHRLKRRLRTAWRFHKRLNKAIRKRSRRHGPASTARRMIFLRKRRSILVRLIRSHKLGRAVRRIRRDRRIIKRILRAARIHAVNSFFQRVKRDSRLMPFGTYFRNVPHSAPALETLWTVIPMVILAAIALPTFSLIYMLDEFHEPALTVKAIGNQWYWSYEYAEGRGTWANAVFDSYMLPEDELQPGDLRLLTVDKELILPIATEIRLLVTSMDVIHSWAVPALGIKVDAVPGRLNEVALYINYMGVYYGQCSELCGVNHAFMPIMIRAISPLYFTSFK